MSRWNAVFGPEIVGAALVGIAVGLLVGALLQMRRRTFRIAPLAGMLAVSAGLGVALYLVMTTGRTGLVEAGFALMAGFLAALLIGLIERIANNEPVSIESKWGSVGGTKAGYEIPHVVVLIAIFGGCVLALLVLSYQGTSTHSNSDIERRQDLRLSVESTSKEDKK